jgi:hypothetical protein
LRLERRHAVHREGRASSGRVSIVATVLADYGNRYQSKLFNPAFLRSKNLPVPVPDWLV